MSRSSVLRWRVRREILILKAAGALALAVVTVLSQGDARGMLLAGAGTVMLAALALRDLLAPVRLSADGEGVVVTKGFAGSERVPWSEVERIRVDTRTRLTSRTELLEIETRDGVFLLSRFDLGVPVQQVADALRAFRTGS
ncbi:PH domain-containing protein [Planomonospora parontospora]|uniref:PH domain-containing protein n=1 Tax=Planomonospora parontospora TaxID=58119 RepID=UPI001670CEFE|nr:PH domain-containing protein [Planomonospora parontospora]